MTAFATHGGHQNERSFRVTFEHQFRIIHTQLIELFIGEMNMLEVECEGQCQSRHSSNMKDAGAIVISSIGIDDPRIKFKQSLATQILTDCKQT